MQEIQQEAIHFQTKTLSNFKRIFNNYQHNISEMIELKSVVNNLLMINKEKNKIFDFRSELENMKQDVEHVTQLQQYFLEMYEETNKKTAEIQSNMNRLEADGTSLQIRSRDITATYYKNVIRLKQLQAQYNSSLVSKRQQYSKRQSKLINQFQKEVLGRNEVIQQEIADYEKQYREDLSEINLQIKNNQEQMKAEAQEMVQLRDLSVNLKAELRILYRILLKRNPLLSKKDILWLVKAVLRLEQNSLSCVESSNIFPDYLDADAVSYLIKQAKLDIAYEKLSEKYKQKQLLEGQNLLSLEHDYDFGTIRERIHALTNNDIVKIRKPVFHIQQYLDEKCMSLDWDI